MEIMIGDMEIFIKDMKVTFIDHAKKTLTQDQQVIRKVLDLINKIFEKDQECHTMTQAVHEELCVIADCLLEQIKQNS